MKTTKTFENASLVSVMNGSVIVKSAAGIEHTFTNASVISINNGTIIIESEWTPKRGELIKLTGCNTDCYCIYRQGEPNYIYDYGYKKISDSTLYTEIDDYSWYTVNVIVSPVTPEEQQAFDDFCKSKGKIWNKEKLQWEKYQWKPTIGDQYYHVDLELLDGVGRHFYTDDSVDQCNYRHYNCFQTKEEAQKAAEKVKELLKSLSYELHI